MTSIRFSVPALVAALAAFASCTDPVSNPCLGVTCDAVANGTNACVAGSCVVTCTAPFQKDPAGTACVSPNTPEACGPAATACPTDPNGTATCTGGTCGLTCNTPRVPNAAGDACVSPNTPDACGDALVECPGSDHGTATCSAAGECGLECTAPYVPSEDGSACVSPNTPEACGPSVIDCPGSEHGTATCSAAGECGLDCTAPFVLDEAGTACVSPNTPDACGEEALPCPAVANGSYDCLEGSCVIVCDAPRVPGPAGDTCISPNTPEACGEALTTCPAPSSGSATCSAAGECGHTCPAETEYRADGHACLARFSSCWELKQQGFVTNGTYYINQPEGDGTATRLRYCDQSTDGGGWMRLQGDMVQVSDRNVSVDVSEDADGARIAVQANAVGCAGPASDTTFLAPGVPWTQVRYTESFGNKAGCWSVFGDETQGPDTPRPNLVPYDPAIDAIAGSVGMGFGGNDLFVPPNTTCAETPHFWAASRSPRLATLIQRRARAGEPAGVSTRATCFPDEATAEWTYSSISVRECPMTVDACGATCSACPAVANGTSACVAGGCVMACDAGFVRNEAGDACILDCALHLGAPVCTPNSLDTCAEYRFNFEDTGTTTVNAIGASTATVGSLVTRVPGISGRAVRLVPNAGREGGVDFGSIGNFGTLDFTLMFWARTTSNAFTDVLGNRSAGSHGNFIQVRFMTNGSYGVEIDQDGGGTNYAATGTQPGLNDGNWHHIAVVREGVNLTIYADGVQAGTTASADVANIGNANPFLLGSSPRPGVNDVFDATIDEVRVYLGALPPAEIALVDSACDPT